MNYRLLKGETIDLSSLPKNDLEFLVDLQRRAMEGEEFFDLARSYCGTGAYPLKGSLRVTRAIHETPLFRVAEDIVDRVGIQQGRIAPDPDDRLVPIDEIVGVTDAARELGITRSAVIKAAQAGRLQGKKIGSTWALLKRSVQNYQVAHYRVKAGRAAHGGAKRSRATEQATRR